jgi:hypothetical protein
MELLTFIGQAARRKDSFLERAERLAEAHKTLEKLEEEMTQRADALTRKLRLEKITFSEFQRAVAEDTLVSSLAATILGAKGTTSLSDSAYAETMGQMQYLWKFFADIQAAMSSGKIKYGAEEASFDEAEEVEGQILEEIPQEALTPTVGLAIPATWRGINERVKRYLVTPVYRWFNSGVMARRQGLGAKEMRRVATRDKRVCADCLNYDALGWQPIGSLPVPGTRCQCLDRCRCRIDYR